MIALCAPKCRCPSTFQTCFPSPSTSLQKKHLNIQQTLSCMPLLRHLEVQRIDCDLWGYVAPQTLQAFRSLPQSITWGPLELGLKSLNVGSTVQEVCAAFNGTPLAQAVSKLNLSYWTVEPPIAALHASFPNVLHFQLSESPPITYSSLSEAISAWPMLQSVSVSYYDSELFLASAPGSSSTHGG